MCGVLAPNGFSGHNIDRKGFFVKLSIIIVNWNTGKLLHDCLASIRATCSDMEYEILIVDNDSSDGSREMIKEYFPEVHLINSGSNMGFARANNLAIPLAIAPYILFLNPDTIVLNDALSKMSNFLSKNPDIGAISCKIIDETGRIAELPIQTEGTPVKRFLLQLFSSHSSFGLIKKIFSSHNPYESGYVRYLYGPCLMIRKKVLEEVGYFDERFFMYAEDIELCHRISQKGWLAYYMSKVDIVHLGGKASENAPSDFSLITMCDSISKLMAKNYGKRGAITYRLAVFISSCLRIAIVSFVLYIHKLTGKSEKKRYKQSWKKQWILLKWSLQSIK